MLTEQEKAELLRLARLALETYVKERRFLPAEPVNPGLLEVGGAFVTLERDGELRGCIGHLTADRPIARVVQDMAIAAATQDPRFPPVTTDEVQRLTLEISALSSFRTVTDVGEIRVGRHGLIISDGRRRGLLLPQVAEREGWDAETFLAATCRKAGLPLDAWKRGATIEIFTADVFSEKQSG
ncbi:MAG TPA: AmmeMemoRadiSam system protein A [bacterium]|nr:AmmeMemoRadiSam system protein A [bacterium]